MNLLPLVSPFTKAVAGYGGLWGGFAAAAGAAALFAPAALSNDDRGYGRTAFLTTPVIAAAFATGPSVWSGFQTANSDLRSAVKNNPFKLSDWKIRHMTLPELRDLEQSGKLSQTELRTLHQQFNSVRNRATRAFYSDKVVSERLSLGKLQGNVFDHFKQYSQLALAGEVLEGVPKIPEGFETDMTYALFESNLRASTPGGRLMNPKLKEFPTKALSLDEIYGELEKAKSLPEEQSRTFFENMNRRLAIAGKHSSGVQEFLNPAEHEMPSLTGLAFSKDGEAARRLAEVRGQGIADAMQQAVNNNWVNQAELMLDHTSTPIGIRVSRGKESLTFGLVDAATGKTRIGNNLNRTGAARQVLMPDGMHPLDFHLARALDPKYGSLKNLSEDLASHALHGGNHIDDDWLEKVYGFKQDGGLLTDEVIRLRSQEAAFTKLAVFNGKTWNDLDYDSQVAEIQKREGLITELGSESALKKGVFQVASAEKRVAGQLPMLNQTDFVTRSITKQVQINRASVESPAFMTEEVSKIFGGNTPTVRMNIATVTPQQKTLFGYLPAPERVDGKWQVGDRLRDAKVEREAIDAISADMKGSRYALSHKLSDEAIQRTAESSWLALRAHFEADPQRLLAARRMGALGEGDLLVGSSFRQYSIQSRGVAEVKSYNKSLVGKDWFGSDQVLGYSESGAPVTSLSSRNKIIGVEHDHEKNLTRLHYLREDELGTGAKFDVLGNKGLAVGLNSNQDEMITDALNTLYQTTGRGTPVAAGTKVFANRAYFKTGKSPVQAMMGNAADLMTRLPSQITDSYQSRMSELGMRYTGSGFVEESDLVAKKWATDAAKRERLEELHQETIKLFQKAEDGLNQVENTTNPVFRAYLSGKRTGAVGSLRDYYETMNQTGDAFAWDHSKFYDLNQTRLTFDETTALQRSGEHEIARELNRGATPIHGDPEMAAEYLDHLATMGSNKPLGTVIPLDKVGSLELGKAGSFTGTIFDPSNPEVQGNFSIDLGRKRKFFHGGEMVESQYFPVRGLAGYKASANAYGMGEFNATDYQKTLANTLQAARNEDNDALLIARSEKHFDEAYKDLLGKDGVFRPVETYPHSFTGALQTRATGELVAPGTHNPFEAIIGRESLHKLRDPELVEQLLAGEHVYATGARHPISRVPILKVRLAEETDFLGENMIGYSEGLRSMIQADDDLDLLNLHFLRDSKSIERAKAATTYVSDFNNMSDQWKAYRMVQLLQGNLEDSSRMTNKFVPDGGQIEAGLNKMYEAASGGRFKNISKRLIHGETGTYSNLVTQLYSNLDIHPTVRGQVDRIAAELDMFLPRQVTISAGKGKMEIEGSPLGLYDEMKAALGATNIDEGVKLASDALAKMAKGSNFETFVKDEKDLADIKNIFGVTQKTEFVNGVRQTSPLVVGSSLNLYAERYLSGNAPSIVENFIRNRDRSADLMQPAMTTSPEFMNAKRGRRVYQDAKASNAYQDLKGSFVGGAEANRTSQTLGEINEAWKSGKQAVTEAAGAIGRGFKPAMPILAAGFGLAAVAGLLSTNISSNKHRPEERVGVPDRVPGEPIEGSRSNQPNVRMLPAPPQTRTMVVAPMRRQSDLEVQSIAPDRDAAAETVRQTQQLSGSRGPSNVTVNYVGGARERMSKLRMKQELREQLDSQPQY